MAFSINPTTQANWSPTKWSADGLIGREAGLHVGKRCKDRSSEVNGEPMQQLNIEEINHSDIAVVTIGDDGEVALSQPAATNVALTIDQRKATGILVRDDHDLQVKLKARSTWAPLMGYKLAEDFEDYLLALENGVAAGYILDVAGNIIDATLLTMKASFDSANAPAESRYALFSSNQQVQILADDRFSETTFVGPGEPPVTTGKLKPLYGFEPLWSSRVRRRTISGTDRTINMAWQKDALCKAVQQAPKTKLQDVDIAQKILMWHLYGAVRQRGDHFFLMRTTGL